MTANQRQFLLSFLLSFSKNIWIYLLLIVVTWFARFLLVKDFGLYEDDWAFTSTAINNSLEQNWWRLTSALQTFWQGRPLHMAFLTFIPFWGAKLGGIQALYVIGFILISLNACLWFSFVRRVTHSTYGALIASLFFCLYPADTTFSLLQHLFGLQTALLCILLALHLYITISSSEILNFGLKGTSYLFAILSLLNYESLFLIFFSAPLFRPQHSSRRQKIVHYIAVFVIAIIYLLIRRLAGESRVSEMGGIIALKKITQQVALGPLVSLGSFVLRPIQVLNQLLGHYWPALVISSILFFVILINLFNLTWRQDNTCVLTFWRRWLMVGLLMTFLAYPSALLLSVTVIDGRASRVHFSASLGTTFIFACFWILLLLATRTEKFKRYLALSLLSLQLGLLFTFCLDIQYQYRLSWQLQQAFIKDVITLSSDLQENTVILVQAPSLATGKQINPFDWSLPLVLESIYLFPSDWQFSPKIYRLYSEANFPDYWQEHILKNNQFILSQNNLGLYFYLPWEPERIVDAKNVILLVEEEDSLVRRDYIIGNSGQRIALKMKPKFISQPNFETTIIFDRLMSSNCDYCGTKPAVYFENH
ncbi:hypothetical protein KQ311_04740 [Synechocystis sp. CS-94]|nr:hypothetical protein [Synechocystis sp. CS-94]